MDSLNQMSFTGGENLAAVSTIRGMLDMQTWTNHHLQMLDQLMFMLCAYNRKEVTKIRYVVRPWQLSDQMLSRTRNSSFSVGQILDGTLDLLQEDPDMETLLEESKT